MRNGASWGPARRCVKNGTIDDTKRSRQEWRQATERRSQTGWRDQLDLEHNPSNTRSSFAITFSSGSAFESTAHSNTVPDQT